MIKYILRFIFTMVLSIEVLAGSVALSVDQGTAWFVWLGVFGMLVVFWVMEPIGV